MWSLFHHKSTIKNALPRFGESRSSEPEAIYAAYGTIKATERLCINYLSCRAIEPGKVYHSATHLAERSLDNYLQQRSESAIVIPSTITIAPISLHPFRIYHPSHLSYHHIHFKFQLLDRQQVRLQVTGQRFGEAMGRKPDRLIHIPMLYSVISS